MIGYTKHIHINHNHYHERTSMIRRLNAALLAVALIVQPKSVRADGEDLLKAAAGVVIVGGAIWYASRPDSDETALRKAKNLIDQVGTQSSTQDGDERALQSFAHRYLSGSSFEEIRQKTIKERNAVLNAQSDMRSRVFKADYANRETLRECSDDLNKVYVALSTKLAYLDQYANYFKLHVANERGRALINRGCPWGYDSDCAQDFRKAMDEVERHNNNAPYSALRQKVSQETYPQLAKKYGDICKHIEDDRRQREAVAATIRLAGAVAGALLEASAQQQPTNVSSGQTAAQQREQAAMEQAKKNSQITANQEEVMRQAKARQEQERRQAAANSEEAAMQQALLNDAKTQQQDHAKCTYDTCHKGSGPECPAYQAHKNCTPERCAKGLSQQACPAQMLYHAQCTHDTCYKASGAQCPAYQAHRNCTKSWCVHDQDPYCPRWN